VSRKFLVVFAALTTGSVLVFLAYPTLLTGILIIGVVGGMGMFGVVRFVEWAQDRYGLDERRRDV
jgi:hypothetical protein